MSARLSYGCVPIALFVIIVLLSGCVMSRAQGEQLQQQVQQLRREIAALQRRQHGVEQQIQAAATGSADSVVQQERVVVQLQRLAGQLEQLNQDFVQFKQQRLQVRRDVAATDAFAGLDKTQHLQQAQQLLRAKDYEQAGRAYDALLQRTAKEDALFVKALLGKAEVSFQWAKNCPPGDRRAEHYKDAVRAYHEFLTQVPEKRRQQETRQVLNRAIQSLEALGMTKEAKAFKEELKRVTAKKKRSN